MDPLSVVGTVAGLTATCLQAAKKLHDLKDKFGSTDVTMTAICAEASIISASLSRIQSTMLTNSTAFGDKLREGDLTSTLDAALTGCYVVFEALQAEIDGVRNPMHEAPEDQMRVRDRFKVVWNETSMKDLLGQLRGLQTSLALLLQLLTTDTMSDLRRLMDANVAVLTQVVHKTRQIRQANRSTDAESIFSRSFTTLSMRTGDNVSMISSTRFRFDDQVVNSQAYRRAMSRAYAAIDDQPTIDSAQAALVLDGLVHRTAPSIAPSVVIHPEVNAEDRGVTITSDEVPSSQETLESLVHNRSIYTSPSEEWATKWQMTLSQINRVPKTQIERQFVIHEIIQSERRYLLQLLVFKHLYQDRLLSSWCVFRALGEEEIFMDLRAIFDINKRLLFVPLQQRQLSEGPWIRTITDIIVAWIAAAAPFYKAYAAAYTKSYNTVMRHRAADPGFSQWLEQGRLHPLSNRLEWSDYLKAPIQRLKRSVLLLQTLHRYPHRGPLNWDPNDDNMLFVAVESIKSLTDDCDNVMSHDHNPADVKAINARVIGFGRLIEHTKVLFHQEVRIKKRLDSSACAEIIVYETPNPDVFTQRNPCLSIYKQSHDHESHETKLELLHEITIVSTRSLGDSRTVNCEVSNGLSRTRIYGISVETFQELQKWVDLASGRSITG